MSARAIGVRVLGVLLLAAMLLAGVHHHDLRAPGPALTGPDGDAPLLLKADLCPACLVHKVGGSVPDAASGVPVQVPEAERLSSADSVLPDIARSLVSPSRAPPVLL